MLNATTPDTMEQVFGVVAADISCSEKVCEEIARHPAAGKFIILDHHTTADYLNKYHVALAM